MESIIYRRAMGRSLANSLPQPLPLEKLPSSFWLLADEANCAPVRTVANADTPALWLLDMIRRAASGLPQAVGTIWQKGETLEQAVDYAKSIYGTDDIIWYNEQGGRRPHAAASYAMLSGDRSAALPNPYTAADVDAAA